MSDHTRLRLATRIHFGLLRHLGEGIDVGRMLKNGPEVREILWVCEASGIPELMVLARRYLYASAAEARPLSNAPQDASWARDTSGFGLTTLSELDDIAPSIPRTASWLNPIKWLRGGAKRSR